ncbi:hypothetical protein [Jiulongibacter sp. NS-SX5]|uniref:hypothetical protein n=1 Tax=Jiulongibacter sp. NS-SX5 TaxID=3463854 RepID=UPI004057D182
MRLLVWFSLIALLINCTSADNSITVKMLSDDEYPDNPDIENRHELYNQIVYDQLKIKSWDNKDFIYDIILKGNEGNEILLKEVNFYEMIPGVPAELKEDADMAYIAVINQEWNRQQVRFDKTDFPIEVKGDSLLSRFDLARNCLNAYLWEIILYDEEGKSYYHGWFDFPHELYAGLFEQKSGISFDLYKEALENWKDPEKLRVNFDLLRTIISTKEVRFENLNEQYYPLVGERKKKFKNILKPQNLKQISDFLNDSTSFATFSPPGFYNTKDPRKTYLSELAELKSVSVNSTEEGFKELVLQFKDLRFTLGGVDLDNLPILTEEEMHKGYQNSMGVKNHSFYETYDYAVTHQQEQSAYYCLLTQGENEFVDSHKIGIDGPLLFRDAENNALHLCLLSFERHALVGHFKIYYN